MWSQAQVAWPQALFLHLVYGHTQVAPPTTVHTIFLIPPGLDRVALIVGSAVPGDDDMSFTSLVGGAMGMHHALQKHALSLQSRSLGYG